MTRDASKDFSDTTQRPLSWYDGLGGVGPKPYETKAWVAETVVVAEEDEGGEEEEEETESSGPWWEALLLPEAKPYETTAWTATTTVVAEEEEEEVPSPLIPPLQAWFDSLSGEGPKPYAAKSWVAETFIVSEEEEEEEEGPLPPWWETLQAFFARPYETKAWTVTTQLVSEEEVPQEEEEVPQPDWWETLGGNGPKPYEYASWTFIVSEDFVLEFVSISGRLFQDYDETYFDRSSLGIVLNSGYFGDVRTEVYDAAIYEGSQRGILVKRTFSKMMIYDSKASSPGNLSQIIQPLGIIATDPVGSGGYAFEVEPQIGPEKTEIVADDGSNPGPTVLSDGDSTTVYELGCDGDLLGTTLEAARASNPGDDCPPGLLLGTLSYETFNSVVTITDWEHYNWEDDTPVLKAVQTLISKLPNSVSEVKVLSDPTAFWTSLGFKSAFKGDPYIHYFNG